MLSCVVGGALLAQPSLRITSPADATVVHPGQSFKVKVEAIGKFTLVGVISGNPIGSPNPVPAPPYEFTIEIPADITESRYPLTFPLTATGFTSAALVSSKPITIVIGFPTRQIRLTVQPSLLRLTAGDKGPLKVFGVFPDGQAMDLTPSMQVAFTSSAPGVSTVEQQGVVTAVAPGSAKITATYGDSHVDVPVTVLASRP